MRSQTTHFLSPLKVYNQKHGLSRDILKIRMPNISKDLTLELMRWEGTICGIDKMNRWANGDALCPFENSRLFHFQQSRHYWEDSESKLPQKTLAELWEWIAKELKIKI